MARVNSTPLGAGDRRPDKALPAARRIVHNQPRPGNVRGSAHVIVRSAVGSNPQSAPVADGTG